MNTWIELLFSFIVFQIKSAWSPDVRSLEAFWSNLVLCAEVWASAVALNWLFAMWLFPRVGSPAKKHNLRMHQICISILISSLETEETPKKTIPVYFALIQVQHNANFWYNAKCLQNLCAVGQRTDAVCAVCGQHARTEGFTWWILLSQSVKKYPTASFAMHNTLFMCHCLQF